MAQVLVELKVGGQFAFDVDLRGTVAARFVLGVLKCGSTMLNEICHGLADLNGLQYVDVGRGFFRANMRPDDWRRDPAVCNLLFDGNVYGGFRAMPIAFADHPVFVAGRKVLLVRDPRDALVSLYFSDAYSHPIPDRDASPSRMTDMMEQRRIEALRTGIDEFALKQASYMRRTFLELASVARSAETNVVRYEDYIFHKPELIRLIARWFGLAVNDAWIAEQMGILDQRPVDEDPKSFIRRVTPGDHREKLRPGTIDALNHILDPAMRLFGYE